MNKNDIRLIRIREVMHKVGIARSTVWYMVKNGTLPKPRKLSPRVTTTVVKSALVVFIMGNPYFVQPNQLLFPIVQEPLYLTLFLELFVSL